MDGYAHLRRFWFLYLGLVLALFLINAGFVFSEGNGGERLPIGMSSNLYGWDSVNEVMTDSSGLTFETESSGVVTVNGERYLGFGLKGVIGGEEYVYTSMDFGWTWHVEQDGEDYVFWAENNDTRLVWKQYYYFYKSPWKPMKIKHYLENNIADISDAQMYYLTDVLPQDIVKYNGTKYLVQDFMGLHRKGNFSDLVSVINFNSEYDFGFEDLINNGFTINEFYVGSGSVIGKPNINVSAVGFTKHNGFFPKGTSVWVDPTFSTSQVEALAVTPINETAFVLVWKDITQEDVSFAVYTADGGVVTAAADVDVTTGAAGLYTSVAVAAVNSTAFIVGYEDRNEGDIDFTVLDISGAVLVAKTDVDTTALGSQSVSISLFNETAFVIGWFDSGDDDATFAIYDIDGNVMVAATDADTTAGATSVAVDVSTFNETAFVIGWHDDVAADVSFAVYDNNGAVITSEVDANAAAGDARAVSVSAFNETAFVISWFDEAAQDATFAIHDVGGGVIVDDTDVDTDIGATSRSVYVSAMNSTAFVIGWRDGDDDDQTFAVYDNTGTVVVAATDASSDGYRQQAVISQETNMDIGFCDDNFVMAFTITTSEANWTAYKADGSVWDGTCAAVSDTISPTWTSVTNNASTTTESEGNVSFGVNLADETGLDFAWLEVNSSGVYHNTTLIDINGVSVTLNETNVTWETVNTYVCAKFWFNDTSGNVNESDETCFTVATPSYPSVTSTLESPADGSTDEDGDVTFECSATATNSVLVNISLYHNISQTWQLNQTNSVGGTSNSTTFTINNIPNGTSFIWNCLASNDETDTSFASANRTLIISFPPPPPEGPKFFIQTVSGTIMWWVNSIGDMWLNRNLNVTGNLTLNTQVTPSVATETCDKGTIVADDNYIYYCNSSSNWVRASMNSW